MQLFIDNQCGDPIYEQICRQIRTQILSGDLQADTALPSIRQLARDLRISVITTKRAYDELEREGLLYAVAGKGCFVAARSPALAREEQLRRIESLMEETLRLGTACGLTREELRELYHIMTEVP